MSIMIIHNTVMQMLKISTIPKKEALAEWKKIHKVWMMMMIAAGLIWAGEAQRGIEKLTK